jgi:HEAT repeat protein
MPLQKPTKFRVTTTAITLMLSLAVVLGAEAQEKGPDPRIVTAVRDKDPQVRKGALRAVIRKPDASLVPVLIEIVKTDTDEDVRGYALSALANLGSAATPAIPALIPLMKAELNRDSSSFNLNTPATAALVCIGANAVPGLVGIIQDTNNDVLFRWHAIDALRMMAWKRVPELKPAVPCLVKVLKGNDTKLREIAAHALGGIGPDARAAIPVLAKYLKEGYGLNHVCAAQTLYHLDPKNELIIPALISGLTDKDHFERARAARLLQEIRPKKTAIVRALIETLKDADPNMRADAAGALERIGPFAVDAIPALTVLLKDKDPNVRYTARQAIKAMQSSSIE